uniref:Uncharacterized protein n=1 Tax=Anguilla anguilla TaxID=7936 RepID=A0A0E9TCI6_ANGAN
MKETVTSGLASTQFCTEENGKYEFHLYRKDKTYRYIKITRNKNEAMHRPWSA